MEVRLYNTADARNVLDKTLTNETVFADCKMKKQTSILNPVLYIQSQSQITNNYCYIPSFSRYYFIDDIAIYPNCIYELTCKVDVLKSWKDDILKATLHITAKENSNQYAGEFLTTNQKEITTHTFDSIFSLDEKFILITARGEAIG